MADLKFLIHESQSCDNLAEAGASIRIDEVQQHKSIDDVTSRPKLVAMVASARANVLNKGDATLGFRTLRTLFRCPLLAKCCWFTAPSS